MGTKREKILETAIRLFIENGIQGTATALIAKEAGVATGTLFHHFPSKEDLVHDLYGSIFISLTDHQKEHFDGEADVYDRLRQIWTLDIQWGMAHEEYAHFLERYSFHHYMSASAIENAHQYFDHCIQTFQAAIDQKLFKSDDLQYIKEHFVWNIRMHIIYFIEDPDRCTAENIDKTFDIYMNGMIDA